MQRERLIKLIDEKQVLDNENAQLKLKKRELTEQLGHKTRKVKELKATGQAIMQKLEGQERLVRFQEERAEALESN